MKSSIWKLVGGCIAFLLAYICVDYLLDNKIEWSFAIGGLIGYAIVMIGITIKNKNK